MKKMIAAALSATLLAACGGNERDVPPGAPNTRLLGAVVAEAESVDLPETVAHLYMAYFGRPPDAGAVVNFSRELLDLGLNKGIVQLNEAYGTTPRVTALIDSFYASQESQELYGKDHDVIFVLRIYVNMLGRHPDTDGMLFWVEALQTGTLTRPKAAISIMAAAMLNTTPQGLADAALIRNRMLFATRFARVASINPLVSMYVGNAAAARAHVYMQTVSVFDAEEDIARKVLNLADELTGIIRN